MPELVLGPVIVNGEPDVVLAHELFDAGQRFWCGVAGDYDGLVNGAGAANPQVVVTDIRMPPTFQSEGIMAAREVRKQHPGTYLPETISSAP